MRLVRPDLLRKKQIVNRLFSVMSDSGFVVSDDDLWWAWERYCSGHPSNPLPTGSLIDQFDDEQIVLAIYGQLTPQT